MSDPLLPPSDDDDDLAAEYVLGVLPLAERRAVARRAEVDGAFAARIAAWERRLAPLDDATAEAKAPDLMPAIEARLFPVRPRPSRWRLWGAALATSVALAVMLAVTLWPDPSSRATLVAGDLVIEAHSDGAAVLIARLGPPAESGHDYQLWAIGPDGVPRSLGLVRGDSLRLAAALEPGITLAISLEPLGGAPGPVPTGPVLAAAVLE